MLLVVLDTVRADHLSAYGHDRETSPFLDSLASKAGVLFEDCTAPASWTWPSHASLFTGELPMVHGAHMGVSASDGSSFTHEEVVATRMRDDLPTLAERFAAAGYHTVSLSANTWLDPELGLVRGFGDARVLRGDLEVFQAARALLLEERPAPLFLFVNLMGAHAPYTESPAPWLDGVRPELSPGTAPGWLRPYLHEGRLRGVDLTRYAGHSLRGIERYLTGDLRIPAEGLALMEDLYDGEILLVDAVLGAIFEAFTGERSDVIVAVTSDHGELFGERGLIEHRGNVYPEVLRVPLVIAAPGRLPAGVRVRTPVQVQDLNPTLLDLAGIDAAPGSLVPVVAGEPRRGPIVALAWPDPVWARVARGKAARLRDAWVLHRVGGDALIWSSGGDAELYDLARDPGMHRDLARERPARLASLRAASAALLEQSIGGGTRPLRIPETTRERLRALGYLGE